MRSAIHIGLTQITLLYRVSDLDRTAQIKIFRRENRFLRKSYWCWGSRRVSRSLYPTYHRI